MKTRKLLALLLTLVMLGSVFAITATAAPVRTDYTFTGGEVTVDGTEDVTVNVCLNSVSGGNYYAFETKWSLKEAGDTSYLKLSALTPGGTASPMENDPATGKTYWVDMSFSAPIVVTAGQPVWTATYTVDKDTPTGSYTVSATELVIADTSYDAVELGEFTATINVTNNAASTAPSESEVADGYTVSAGEGASINIGADATVDLKVSHKDGSAYNAYYFEVSYDPAVLTYEGVSAGATVKDDATNGKLTVAGYGADKTSGTAAATLTFTGKAAGNGNVTITKANVDAQAYANVQDAPAATIDETAKTATITVGGYKVTLPDGFTGDATATAGEKYTFTGPTDSAYYDVTATMGGEDTTVTYEDGTYTISNVSGAIEVTATPKTYEVNVEGSGKDQVTLPEGKPTYKSDYTFTLTSKGEGYIYGVTVKIGDDDFTGFAVSDGTYTIPGADVKGNITITVKETAPAPETTSITIEGVTAEEVEGNSLTLTANNGEDFTFTLIKQAGFNYTAKIGSDELAIAEDGSITIPGTKLDGTDLTVIITKTSLNPYEVAVYEYVKLSDKSSVWLVVAKSEENTLKYGTDVMYTSEKYGGYCWLVISGDDADTVKAAAIAAVAVGEGAPTAIAYDGDVNRTELVDVNDAQLVYNIYKAVYDSFDATTRRMFLEADMNGNKTVDVTDAAAVVNKVLGE